MLEVGRIPVAGAAQDRLLAEAAAELMENSGLANIET
jgi:ATP-dependent Lhr-like helicase